MIIYTDLVQWYCERCHDEGEASTQREAERQAEAHECDEGE